jgi:hypothetical protein
MAFRAYNMRLKRMEQVRNPKIVTSRGKRGVRHRVAGVGSDGTKLSAFISSEAYRSAR